MSQASTIKRLVVGCDLDGMVLDFSAFFKEFFTCLWTGNVLVTAAGYTAQGRIIAKTDLFSPFPTNPPRDG